MSSGEAIRAERIRKLVELQEKGIAPYPAVTKRSHEIGEVIAVFDDLQAAGDIFTIAGRITALRRHGGAAFLDLDDGTGRFQVYLEKEGVGEGAFDLFKEVVDRGDFLEVSGRAFVTGQGTNSVRASSWTMLTKSLRALPAEWFGLVDEDERYRKRYLDMLLNDAVRDIVVKRSLFWGAIRSYLLARRFVEVETPVLETVTGGADARPFETHHNALDLDVYLRISAGELWQKKLLVGGMPKVFEIGRIFRNEGMSREHLQDYTQLEFYEAYSDYQKGMELVKDLYRHVAQEVFGTHEFRIGAHDVDLSGEWAMYDFGKLVAEHYGVDVLDPDGDEVRKKLKEEGIQFDEKTLTVERGVDLLWKKIRKQLAGPGFLVGVPVYLEPLAKRLASNPKVVERFQVILAGSEMGKGFSELNDPIDQKERFMQQQALRDGGDEEAQMADLDFVEALEYGMPPAFGFGVSERLFSFLANLDVREGQIFPLMRPRS